MNGAIPLNLSILIADDNEMNRWLLNEQLQASQPRITECEDGAQAWLAIQQQTFDLLMLDVSMPLMSGIELIQRCRQMANPNQHTPAIAVTAHAHSDQQAQCLEVGFTQCLIKPIKLEALQAAIVGALGLEEPRDIQAYAQAILQKTEFNPRLSANLLEKLLNELPEQLESLAAQLSLQPAKAAMVAHKLNGSFCFYGFEHIRPLIATLEQQLLDGQVVDAQKQFERFNERCQYLLQHRQELLDLVANA